MLYYARHPRLDGNVLDFVGITGGIARRDSGALLTIDNRMRMFERAEQIGFVVDVCNDKTESSTPGKLLACEELQGGCVFVPGTVLLCLALAGSLVEERYGVNVREDGHRHAADGREVNAPRQVLAVDPADGLNSG